MTDVSRAESSGGYVDLFERARVSRAGSQTRRRSQTVMVRLTPEEKAEVEADAARRGISAPELFRKALWVLNYVENVQEVSNG